jgi:phosphoribosyl 1,2-cyclic phosphate phosphodiesterase
MSQPAETITATILGCGSSGGVPRVGNIWGDCDPTNPKNRRRRCSLLIEGRSAGSAEPTRIIIDTGCDLREQLLDAEVDRVDAVFYTHAHADHTHGIDDLRVLALNTMKRVDVYFDAATEARLHESFGYCFVAPPGSGYPPILNGHTIAAGDTLVISGPGGDIEIHAFDQAHGDIRSLGFRIGDFAYSCDLSGLPDASLASVSHLGTWVIDALRPTPHPSHLSLPETLELVERLAPRHAVLTNMHIDMDYEQVDATTPSNVSPAYDGMRIAIGSDKR